LWKKWRPFARPRHIRENNMKMELRETEWEGLNWIHPAKDRDQSQIY